MFIATYLIDKLPSRVLGNETPLSVLSKFYPTLNDSFYISPRVLFGYVSYVHIHAYNCNKLDAKAFKCVFLDTPKQNKDTKFVILS